MTTYKIYSDNPDMVVRDDITTIPIGDQFGARFLNPDFIEYMLWIEAGNKPEYIERHKDEWIAVKEQRNKLLLASDWTQLLDVVMDKDTREAWQAYRQALRDITGTFESPNEVIFPEQPKVK